MQTQIQATILLFEGLEATELRRIHEQMQPRHFNAGEFICREGEQGNSLFVISSGVAQVMVGPLTEVNSRFANRSLARLTRGDVVGEMALLTGEPHSATVIASIPTTALELTQEAFVAVLARYPAIAKNLSRTLSRRLAALTNTWQSVLRHRNEAVALVVDQHSIGLVQQILAATRSASPHSIGMLDFTALSLTDMHALNLGDNLAMLDDLLRVHITVIVVINSNQKDLPFLLKQMNRVVAVVNEAEVMSLATIVDQVAGNIDVVLLTENSGSAPYIVDGMRIIRTCNLHHSSQDIAWLGRHLSRTKLGLALGAGGAKGYAHIAILHILEKAGYTIDYVGGSSIGAIVAAWLAMGKDAAEIEATMRRTFTHETAAATFKLSLSGMSTGHEIMMRLCQETTNGCSFSDLLIPLVVMSVDLNTRQPVPITEGSLWKALMATTALPGMFPPYQNGEQRLVDGVTLIPVPAKAVEVIGADITVSVNLMSRELLPAWSDVNSSRRTSMRMLDTLLEVMDLSQLDASVRSAAQADVIITPCFGPATWRDFHLADLFMAAGREAAMKQLAVLGTLARPQTFA